MNRKMPIFTFIIVFLLILFLRLVNIFQKENGLGHPLIMIFITIIVSIIVVFIEYRIDKNYNDNKLNYDNIDFFRYIFSIIIIVLHMRPFLETSNQLDLAFNNIVSRICVPFFFVVTGYFVAKKEKDNPNYIKKYIKSMIPLYLTWCLIYLPIILISAYSYLPQISSYISMIKIPVYLLVPLSIILIPIALIIVLLYTGTYYHLWYFPAVMLSLFVLSKWKKRWKIKYLFVISFILLLFGATETYYGFLPSSIKDWLSYYYNLFFTTRNFLFFGLFYVVMGYWIGNRKKLYSNHSFLKLIVCVFLLIAEALILQGTERLNSNILLSCVPLVYYLFLSAIYMDTIFDFSFKKRFRILSKYYYLIHPLIIFIFQFVFINNMNLIWNFLNVIVVVLVTHFASVIIIKLKVKHPNIYV